jgi:tetratricopeptide (TPR) repeat protein
MDKNEPLAVYELARYYDTMKDYDNAKYYFKRAYEINDSYTYYWYYIGYLCMKNGKYSEAINNFQLYIDKETRIEELYSSELSSLLEECRQRIAKCQQYLNV